MKGESESVSFLSPVKTRSTYGPTIVAIAQGPFAWRFIKTVTSFTDLLIEDVLRKKESSLQDTFPSYTFLGFSSKAPKCSYTLPTFLSLCTLRTSRFCLFNRTDTTCCQIKMGMVVAYLGVDHHMFNKTDTACQQVNYDHVTERTQARPFEDEV